jgi:plastocyanin
MRIRPLLSGVIVLIAIAAAAPNLSGHDDDRHGNQKIVLNDDCDPNDPAWGAVPGCLQEDGDVSNAEFNALLRSRLYDNIPPLADPADPPVPPNLGQFLVGHPSWRIESAHIVIREGKKITVTNKGGRPHTFTEVAEYGGGRVPLLLVGTTIAPECVLATGATDPTQVAAGARFRMTAENVGLHKFQCCFHPWMRATVRVVEKDNHHDH